MGVSKVWAVNHTGGYIYFLKPSTWTESKVMMFVGHDSYTSVYEMEKMTNTDNLYRYTMPKWDNANYVAFANGGSVWGSGDWGSSNRTNAPHYTNVYKDYGFNSGSYYVIVPSGTGNNASITINYTGTTASSVNRTTKAISSNAAAGTVSVSGYYLSSATAVSTRSAVSSTASNTTASTTLAPASTATFKATANTGYEFVGWYDAASGGNQLSTSTTYTVKYDISFSEKTVYGRFRAKTYTVTLNASGGTGGTGSVTATYNAAMPSATMPTRNGYTFKGYYDAQSGGTQYYDKDGKSAKNWDKTAATTLYAQWELATYTITYDNLKGATHTNPATYTINSATITFTAPTSKPAGYTFANWSPASITTGSTGNKTVTANWTAATSTVELNQEEATEKGTASVTATYGSAMPAITKLPIRTGYTFGGYYTGKNGAGTQYYKADGTSATTWHLEGAQTLYAKWTPITYSVKFNGNGSTSGSMSNQSFTYDEAAKALTTNAFKKTGYTFAGWNTAANGSGTSYADKATVRNLTTTNNATINLYAQWTIDKYTLTFGAGEGGSVTATVGGKEISSPATLEYNTEVTLTATPSGKNAFAQWVNGNGNQVSTNNPYELPLKGNTTIKAEFTSPSKVYLKPFDFWKSDDARIAAYYWGAAGNNWIELSPVDCEGHYYSVDIPAGYSNIIFARLKPSSATGYDKNNNGFNWENSWNQTADLTVQTNGKNLYDMHIKDSRIYLKPNSNWKAAGARFAAFFKVNADNNDGAKWMSMFQLESDHNYYWCEIPTDQNYIKVIFCRMDGANPTNDWSNRWDESKQLDTQTNENNCFTINDGDWNNADGSWSCYQYNNKWTTYSTPTYNVTIKPTIHGTYSVVCNGRTYPVSYKEDIVIPDVPVGTVLTIQDVKPNKETEYTSNIIYKESTNAAYQTLEGNQITVCGNTTIDENFVTKNTHVVYLRIPTNDLAWGTGNYQKLSVYNKLTESYTPTPMTAANGTYEPGYTYYTYTIPAGTHTIRFEYINGNTKYQTHDFPHVMPLGSLNCYTIHSKEGETIFNGYWSELLSNGDYRLLYVEQTVEKDANNKTIINRRKAHPSDIIPASIISAGDSKVVSLHIFKDRTYTDAVKKYDGGTPTYYESNNNPEVILQQYNSSTNTWENKERHMVFGPLKTLPGMAMAPGRRNAAADAELVYDDGIEIIKSDDHSVHPGSGVWNFTVKQLAGNQATIDLTSVERYTGEYYIRTDVANGGWFNYNPTNHMTRSDEAKANSNFSHYYCKWIESDNNVNVKFTVANDFGYAISDTLEADRTYLWGEALAAGDKMVTDQKLPKSANVRFAWNEYSNFVHRAYIAGSANVSDRFLVLEGDANIFDANGNSLAAGVDNGTDPRYGLNANEQIFRDNSNWIYYADVQMKPMAPVKVTAKYNGKTQYFIGKQNETVTLLQGSGSKKYLIRMLYDFKTNQLISAYVPGTNPNDVHAISTNLMIIRQNNENATQLMFSNETPSDMINIPTDRRAYGVIEFTKERLIDDKSLNAYARSLYWISFPFDVNVAEAISFGEYGKHWIIQEYNGERRAKEGMWLDSETFWDYKWDQNITLKAGKGYVLALDVDQIASDGLFGLAGDRPIGIYFPSTEYISTAITEQTQVSTTVPAWVCTINRKTDTKGDRRIADSHWNVIGVPSYRNTTGRYQFAEIETKPTEVKYYYRWDGNFNAYTAMETTSPQDFQSTYAYMVQFTGQINWTNIFNVSGGAPQALAARQSTDAEKEHRLRLELHQNGNKADHTFVRLQEDGVTNRFDFNHDLCKVINAGANIYSIITAEESPVEVAANVMPIAETIIPLGVKITAAGEYTFAMPDGTDGIVVELIDYETNTTTNLLLDNYTVNLGKGTFENRFALHVQPSKVTTSVEDINTNTTGVKKYLIDGVLYMQKDGVLYDAQGKLVR